MESEMKAKVTYVSGGCRSGKSRFAESLATEVAGNRVYLATAEILDDEMRVRVERHRKDRGAAFQTIEATLDLAAALRGLPSDTSVVLIDCLTVWLGNLMHYQRNFSEQHPYIQEFLQVLREPPCPLIMVSNELGMGIVPESAMGRRFRDVAGRLNQEVAAISDEAYFVVSGLSIPMKGGCS